jgi:hypothetical protein
MPDAAPTAESSFPTIPDGAEYTLYCATYDVPTHIPDTDRLKNQLIRSTGLKDWYVIHGSDQSTLYYGFYKTYSDDNQPLEKKRAQSDRAAISKLRDHNGDAPFAGCGFQPINSPDPDAPPEWDIRHAKGYWTLQIGAYKGSPERKKYAVDAVRAARAMGIEAYYFHGASVSSVLIGTWPREAVKEQDSSTAKETDPNKTVVVTNEPLPKNFDAQHAFSKDGRPVKVYAPNPEIADPNLLATMKKYPANAVNGQLIMRNVKTTAGIEQRPDPSFLVVIPDIKGADPDTSGTPVANPTN